MNLENNPGIPCPKCSNKISVSLQDLLYKKSIKCPFCFLELTMDREKSKDTISAMSALDSSIKNAEASKTFTG